MTEPDRRTHGVAILGAGMAGAVAARVIAGAGVAVQVFDKGRGVGGRMATRRVGGGDLAFDHGAPQLRAHGAAFAARVADWERRGVVAAWDGAGHVGLPGMMAPVRDLLAGLPVASGTVVVRIGRAADGWRVTDGVGAVHGPFAALALTFPTPQLSALLDASGLALPGLEQATYAPCWSLMLAAEVDLPDAPVEPADGPIGLIVREASKPGRPAGGRLVAHARPDWSRAHLEEPREAVEATLCAALADALGTRPTYASAHRWRYAQVETGSGEPCLYDPSLRLGAAGDWCLAPDAPSVEADRGSIGHRDGVEAAHDSGLALGRRILSDLGLAEPGASV